MSARALALFSKQLDVMLRTGVPLVDALALAGEAHSELEEPIQAVTRKIEQGHTFSRALYEHPEIFPDTYVALIEVGERSGALVGIVNRLAVLEERRFALTEKLRSAAIYPGFLVATFLATLIVFAAVVLPSLEDLFASLGQDLPWPTQVLVFVGGVLRHPAFAVQLVLLPVCLWLLAPFLKQWLLGPATRAALDRTWLTLPPFSALTRRVLVVRILYVLGCALESGMDLVSALKLCEGAVGNVVVREQLATARRRMIEGDSVTEALSSCTLLAGMPLSMIRAGQEASALEEMTRVTCRLYEMEIDLTLASLTALVEPIIMSIMGLCAGFLFVAAILPTSKILTAI